METAKINLGHEKVDMIPFYANDYGVEYTITDDTLSCKSEYNEDEVNFIKCLDYHGLLNK